MIKVAAVLVVGLAMAVFAGDSTAFGFVAGLVFAKVVGLGN